MIDASPFWQNAFLVGVLVAVGWCIWSGWRSGLARGVVSIMGMVAGCFVGAVAGAAVGAIAGAAIPLYGGLIGMLVGVAAGLAAYVAVSFLGALLFKRTAQQPTAVLRLIYGLGGALIGIFVGVSVFWGALLFVRGIGGFCEATVRGKSGFYGLPIPAPAARAMVKLKLSVEAGETGKFLDSLDVMPAEYYRIMEKLGRLAADPAAARKFITYPGIEDVLKDLRFTDLTNDSEIQELARTQNAAALVRNPKMLDAVKDPGLIAKLQKIDIEKALDYALSPAAPKPTPHSTHQ